jgi:tetratricopeptide (TPR) repeat protein
MELNPLLAHSLSIFLALCFCALTLYDMPRLITSWLSVRRVYGHIPCTLSLHMWQYAKKSRSAFITYIPWVLIIVGIGYMFRGIVRGDLPSAFILLVITGSVFALEQIALILVPPTILYLGTSHKDINLTMKELSKLFNYRTVTLIHPSVGFELSFFKKLRVYNYFRTQATYQWRSTVYHLMDVVPLIVFDAKYNTTFLKEEKNRIQRLNYLYKTLFVVSSLKSPHAININNELIVERYALCNSIRDFIKGLDDTELRKHRQIAFNNMLKAIPKRCRFPMTEYGLVAKAQFAAAFGRQEFLHFCKKIKPEEEQDDLIEDIPSLVSRDDELIFLRENRALEEAEILLNSVQEQLSKIPDENNDINIGNVYNKLSQIARLKGQWERAIELSEKAMGFLRLLALDSHPNDEPERHSVPNFYKISKAEMKRNAAKSEMGTAHYIMGECYMAQFRHTNDLSDRSRAIDNFNRSILFDQEVERDTKLAEKRLKALH